MSNPIAIEGTIVPAGSGTSPGGAQGIQGVEGPPGMGEEGVPGPPGMEDIGSIKAWPVVSAPAGWLLCDGAAVSRTSFSDLYALLGDTYGAGDGSTTFNVPDLRSRFVIGGGQGTGLTNRVLAEIGGEENHQLTLAELASHSHTATQDTHSHNAYYWSSVTYSGGGGSLSQVNPGGSANLVSTNAVSAGAITIGNAGGDTEHNNIPPFIVLTYIIKASPTGGSTAQAPLADSTQDGLLRQVSGSANDYVGGDNTCHPLSALIPAGVMLDFGGTVAPGGFLICDGAEVSRTDFANLFAVIGVTFGAGDGSTTFNLPDCRSRTVVGAGKSGSLTDRVLATVGGEENHVLTVAELATHSHVMNDGGHRHTLLLYQSNLNVSGGTLAHAGWGGGLQTDSNPAYVTNQNTGSNTAHNNMSPFIALNKIIKT